MLDVFSRRVIGWAIADHLRASLVCAALRMAVAMRGGCVAGVIFHPDRGCPIHLGRVPRPLRRTRRTAVDGQDRRVLG